MSGQHAVPRSDAEIARDAVLRPIAEIAAKLGIPEPAIEPYGRTKGKIALDWLTGRQARPGAKLILVTAINPTPAGEGKTTTTIGLNDALNYSGKRSVACLREPSLGPCFGVKGGAAGGGYAQVVPMDEINLHFTGDFHAIGSANNLLAALIDNHLYWGNRLGLDARRITWRRALDMNDRALRAIVSSLGGAANGYPREDGFAITVASEVMAIFCLANDLADLQARLARIVVGQTRDRRDVTALELEAVGAMAVLLRTALAPNLVQSLEGNPVLVHGGPFANIAHGCNSVIATRAALTLADYVVTEAGFGADLGAEKFLDIKCRQAGLAPDCAVLVATIRALKMHGGVAKAALDREDLVALRAGFANLARHVRNLRGFGLPVVVAVNRFSADTDGERRLLGALCDELGVPWASGDHWARGGEGAAALAECVVNAIETMPASFALLYPDAIPLFDKIEAIATRIYGADGVVADAALRRRAASIDAAHPGLPVCVAKTQYSFSADPSRLGAPTGFTLPLRELRLFAGAGFAVALCGDINTMPGLPAVPAAARIGLDAAGSVVGLS